MNSIFTALENFAGYIPAIQLVVYWLAWIIGLVLVIAGFGILKNANSSHTQQGTGSAITYFIAGVSCMGLAIAIDTLSVTLFQGDATSNPADIFSYAPITVGQLEDAQTRRSITSIIMIIQFIGLLGFLKGITLLVSYNKGTIRETSPIWVHLGAGVCAINFPVFFGLFEKLFSTTVT